MTRVLVVGETETVRRGLEAVVVASPSIELAGSLTGFSTLSASLVDAAPDVILVATNLDLDGLLETVSNALPADGPPAPALVALSPNATRFPSRGAVEAGIRAVLPMDATAEEISAAIIAAAVGLLVAHPAAMTRTNQSMNEPPRGPGPQLTGRELQILTMLAEGLGNKEIAWKLRISEHTVKFHISSIFTKLDVSSRAEAVSLGFRFGLILV